jgi:protein SCO1/2
VNRWWIAAAAVVAVAAHASSPVPDVGWTQRIGAPLPLQLAFLDEGGQRVILRDYFHGAPVVIAFAYLSCTRLCPEVLTGVDEVLRGTGLAAGRDYELVVLSIDPNERHRSLQRNAHLLTSPDGAVAQVATAAGFRYLRAGAQTQFAHGAGFIVATPSGTISRYFFGVRYPADEVKAALLAARDNRTGTLASRLLLLCYGLDGAHSDRSEIIMTTLRALAVFGLILGVAFGWRFFADRSRQ